MNCSRNLLLQTFFKKTELKGVTNTKTQKTDIFELEWLHGVHPTAESGCAVCITPWSQEIKISQKAPQWDVHRGLESSSAMCITTQSQTVHRRVKIKTFRRNPFRGEKIYHERKDLKKCFDLLSLKFWLRGVLHTAESNFLNFVIKYLGEIEPNSKML